MSVGSPCINVCRMHAAAGCCEGCGRTLDEIARWTRMDDAARLQVWRLLPARLAELRQQLQPTPPAPS